jgi:phosphatidylglycerophosphate synthase
MTARIRFWFASIRTPSDWLCLLRLLLAPVIWLLAITRKPKAAGAGVVLSGATDVLDGAISRLTGRRSEFGSQFDSVADMTIILSSMGWMALLYPDVARRRRRALLVLGGSAALLLSIEWRKFHKLGAMHIHSARAAGIAGHLYVLNLFGRGEDSRPLFTGFLGLASIAAAESLFVIVQHDDLDHLSETPLLDALFDAAGMANPLQRLPFFDPLRR